MEERKRIAARITNKQKKILIYIMAAVLIGISLTGFLLIKQGNVIAERQTERYLAELSFQTSKKVNQRVESNLLALYQLRDELAFSSAKEQEQSIANTTHYSAFTEIGYLDKEGIFKRGTVQDDVANSNVYEDIKKGRHDSVSNRLLKLGSNQEGVLYAVEASDEGHIALCGFIPTDTMKLLLNTDTFQGVGFSHIVSTKGDFILKSQNENAALRDGSNFFSELQKKVVSKGTADDIAVMKERMRKGESGNIEYKLERGGERTLTYVPLDSGYWYLLSIAPTNVLVNDIDHFTTYSIIAIILFSTCLFTLLFIFILHTSMKKISDIEYVDAITLGYTKARFDEEVSRLAEHFTPFTYVLLDIRKFKLINDLTGSVGGDMVLKYVHDCIKKHLRSDEFVARFHSDYFEMVLQTTDKTEISKRLVTMADEINRFNGERETPYYLQVDCGIYIVKEMMDDIVLIRDRANSARKNNKENNRSHELCSYVYYSDMERLQMVHEKELDNCMEKALEDEEFLVYLQPKVDLSTNKIAGAEALVRWDSSVMGFLPPYKFIPYFEKTGFIVKVDEYVFRKVCKQIRAWLDAGRMPVPISVNLSRRALYNEGYLMRYKEIQKQYRVPSELLEIELTETLFTENLELLKKTVLAIHEAGYLCSMDDFGSGYSSLSLLKEVPVDILKLDRTFFDDAANTRSDRVVEHVIALAKDLHMQTIAEGIETMEQVEQLRGMQCDLIQGYVFYKPMDIASFQQLMEQDEIDRT